MLRIPCVLASAGIPSIHKPRDHETIRPGTSQLLTEIGKYFKEHNCKAEFFFLNYVVNNNFIKCKSFVVVRIELYAGICLKSPG